MEFRHIRYFLAVSDHRSFTRAAAALGIAQPPLSAQIAVLEREVGSRLFERRPQGVALTPAGEAFRSIVETLPSQIDLAIAAAGRAERGETGAIAVGFTPSSIFNPEVAGIINRSRRHAPDVRMSMREENSAALLAGVAEGALDIAFVRMREVPSTFELVRLGEEAMVAAVPAPPSASAQGEPIALKSLAAERVLLFPRTQAPILFEIVMNACRSAGFEPKLGQTIPQYASILNLVAAGFGAAIVPASMKCVMVAGVTFCDLLEAPAAPLSLVWRRADLSPSVHQFVSGTRA